MAEKKHRISHSISFSVDGSIMKVVTGEKQKVLTLRDLQALSAFKKTYTAETVDEYADQLAHMNLTDLQREGVKANVVPVAERKRLEKNMIAAFQKAKNAFDMANRGLTSGSRVPSGMTDERRKKIEEIGKNYR